MPRASCLALGPDTALSSRQLHGRPLHPYGRPAHLARARPAYRPSATATTADLAISPHPDALIRRQEAEERQRKRREQVAKAGKNGLKWWQAGAPSNVQYVNSVEDMQDALEVLKGRDGLAFIDFYATHCVACKTMYPKLRQIAERNPDVTFFKVNAGEDGLRPYCESIGVHKVPYFHVYKAGVLVSEFSANLSTINRVRGELKLHQQQ